MNNFDGVEDRCPFEDSTGQDANNDGCIDTIGDLDEIIDDIIEDLQDIIDNNHNTPLADKVEDVKKSVEEALKKLEAADYQGAIGELEGAVGDLLAAINEGLDVNQGVQLIDHLVISARVLAVNAINQAECDPDHSDISDANESLAQGDDYRSSCLLCVCDDCKEAVNKYKDALSKAEGWS